MSLKKPFNTDAIETAFRHFCNCGEPTLLNANDIGYLKHCLELCGGNTSGHPLFSRWVIEGNGMHIESFLIQTHRLYTAKKGKK